MIFIRRVIWAAIFAALSNATFAGESSGAGYITELWMPAEGGVVRIRFSEPIKNPDGCGGAEIYMRELGAGPGASRFVAILLTAYTSGKRVHFWVQGCTQFPYWGATRPQISDVYMLD